MGGIISFIVPSVRYTSCPHNHLKFIDLGQTTRGKRTEKKVQVSIGYQFIDLSVSHNKEIYQLNTARVETCFSTNAFLLEERRTYF